MRSTLLSPTSIRISRSNGKRSRRAAQTVNTALASGTGPDIIFYDAGPGYAGVLANADLLSPLDQYAAQYGWGDKIAAQSLEATSLNGSLYGLPLQVDLIGMYYNKTLLDKEGWQVPQTVEDLKAFCAMAKGERDDPPIAFSDNKQMWWWCLFFIHPYCSRSSPPSARSCPTCSPARSRARRTGRRRCGRSSRRACSPSPRSRPRCSSGAERSVPNDDLEAARDERRAPTRASSRTSASRSRQSACVELAPLQVGHLHAGRPRAPRRGTRA